jgi:D-alanyl-lipoteichoic acid acyltransferase DltB (MBOAT superfamily)
MLFTSVTFGLFFFILFILYWTLFKSNLAAQNALLLVAGYIFYGWWDWKFLGLLVFISANNFILSLLIQEAKLKNVRKSIFFIGLIINIFTLFLFKYFNFFTAGFVELSRLLGFATTPFIISLVLPVGISFYIFIATSYLIDSYQNKFKASGDLIQVFLSFSFFPVILAGPIQRPASLLPCIGKKRDWDSSIAVDGLRQVLWGVFMKLVIADRCSPLVAEVFTDYAQMPGSSLVVGGVLFAVQIYTDFAGYSNIAIGIGKLLGFKIIQNFNYPYFSRDINSFWKKWNISLTTWFRDYIFLPVSYALSRKIKSDRFLGIKTDYFLYIAGITITWLFTGLWHGANYTYIVWGCIHGAMLVIYHLSFKSRKKLFRRMKITNTNPLIVTLESVITLSAIVIAWIFFRSESIADALNYISGIFSISLFSHPITVPNNLIFMIVAFFFIEWIGKNTEYGIASLGLRWHRIFRWGFYYLLIGTIFYFTGVRQEFIYFQF